MYILKNKITSNFTQRLTKLFSLKPEILLRIISTICLIDHKYLCENKTFITVNTITNNLKENKKIPLLPIWQNENTICLFIDKKHQKIYIDENKKIKIEKNSEPQRFVGVFFYLNGKKMNHSFEECLLGNKKTNTYTDGCIYYFVNVHKIINDYFNNKKLSNLEKIIAILGIKEEKEMKNIAGTNNLLINLVEAIKE